LILVHFNKKIMKLGRYIVGLISGLTFGMLFAPKKGKDLRKDIAQKGTESSADGLKALGEAFLSAGGEAWEEIKNLSEHEQVEAVLEMSKEKLREYLSIVEEKGGGVAAIAQEKLEEIAELATNKARQFKNKAQSKKNAVSKKVTFAKRKVKNVTTVAKPKAKKRTTKKRK
jgi:gas vesicle protein